MPVVGLGIRYVAVEENIEPHGAEDHVVGVLDVAAKLVLVVREEFGMADCWEVQYLGNDTGDALLSSHDCQNGRLVYGLATE